MAYQTKSLTFAATKVIKKKITAMKKVLNVVLFLCALGLAYICVGSIMGTINFSKERAAREKQVIARLIDIRSAQVEFRNQNAGQYTDSFDQLIDFVKNGQIPFVMKVGELNDAQLEKGLTEAKAVAMIKAAREATRPRDQKKLWKELEDAGLATSNTDGGYDLLYSRDTSWMAVLDTIYPKGFCADSLRYVPFGNGAEFELAVGCDSSNKSGTKIYLFEAKTPYTVYLQGINKTELANIIDDQVKLDRYPGLKVGDAQVGNNNAGNWE